MLPGVHIAFSVASLVLGAFVLLNIKGTRLHRWVGTCYCASMVGLNLAAVGIYNLTGHFNLFHFTAILSLATVLVGWSQVLFRHRLRNWFYRHYVYMCWSYAALIAASVNEGFVRLAPLKALVHSTGNWVIIVAQVVLLCAAALFINRSKAQMVARYGKKKSPHSALEPTATAP
jgi:uncharacterized membrane protein